MSKRILVVDDEAVVLGAVAKALRKTDYLIDTVQSAEEALIRLNGVRYDLVIADLMMPGLDGLELIKRLRGMGSGTETIMITGYPTVESALEAKRLGAFEYVTKPFTRQELLSVVLRALRATAEPLQVIPAPKSTEAAAYAIPGHSWVKAEPDRSARMGMTRAFAGAVGDVADIELPAEDDVLEQGRVCAVIRAEDGVEHYLHAPLSGRVVEVNPAVVADLGMAVRDPEGEGWLVRLEPEDMEREVRNLIEMR